MGRLDDTPDPREAWPLWMAELADEIDTWRMPDAWREYLGAVLSAPGANDNLTAWTLEGPMWARRVLEAVS
jgi:hypothetical protein